MCIKILQFFYKINRYIDIKNHKKYNILSNKGGQFITLDTDGFDTEGVGSEANPYTYSYE